MSTQPLIMFPYSGYKRGERRDRDRERIFWQVVETCYDALGSNEGVPLVVLNYDTERHGGADVFLQNMEQQESVLGTFSVWSDKHPEYRVEVLKVWSTDTCQMWLAGWGHIINVKQDVTRIVLLPGDIDYVANERDFFNELRNFVAANGRRDIILGDFHTGDRFSAKELIDVYGTYALLANWFPDVSRKIFLLPLRRPRTEFLNITRQTLEELLGYRKFAYEQTVNMIIRSCDFETEDKKWKYKISTQRLGMLRDDRSLRRYRDCLDQIERTERMLKLLWREIHYDPKEHGRFVNEYDRLDRRSTSIRTNAMITLRTLLEDE